MNLPHPTSSHIEQPQFLLVFCVQFMDDYNFPITDSVLLIASAINPGVHDINSEVIEALLRCPRHWSVSMPYGGQHTFLPTPALAKLHLAKMCQCPITGNIHFYSGLLLPLCRKASRGSTLQQLYEYSEKGFFEALFWFFQKCPALLTFYWHIISIPDRTAPCNKNATRL